MSQNLPEKFVHRLTQIIPEQQFSTVINSFVEPRKIGFRFNTLLCGEVECLDSLKQSQIAVQKFSQISNAYYVDCEFKTRLTATHQFANGEVYIQNFSSMLPAILLNPDTTDRTLDIAAAPGSKTTQLAAMMQNMGWISAVEINKQRFFRLLANLKLAGTSNVHTYLMDGANVWKKCPEQFDKILVDAPCSSESRMHTSNPESCVYWSEKKIQEMCKKQRRLLYSAVNSLKPGGELIYSTCSFAPEENESAINNVIEKFGDALKIVPFTLPISNIQPGLTSWKNKNFCKDINLSTRILPNEIMDGFYICKIRKLQSTLRL